MKKFMLVLVLFGLMTSCTKVPAGYVGVKVYLLGGAKGVESEELGVGRYWIGVNEDLFLFPTFTQNYVWTQNVAEGSPNDESITFQNVKGMDIGADVGISYSVRPNKVNLIFQKYRKGIGEITDIYLRNMVRDAFVRVASTKEIEDIYGRGKSQFIDEVQDMVRAQVGDVLNVEKVYLIGKLRLPEKVLLALNDKMVADQRVAQKQSEVALATAEANKQVETAKGRAESIRLTAIAEANALQVRAEVLAKNPSLIEYEAVQKWDGVLSQVTGGGGSGFIPMINLSK